MKIDKILYPVDFFDCHGQSRPHRTALHLDRECGGKGDPQSALSGTGDQIQRHEI